MIDWSALVIGPTIGVFGVPCLFDLGGDPFKIQGVFDEAYTELTPLGRGGMDAETFNLGSPASITAEMPVLGIQMSQFPKWHQPKQGHLVQIPHPGGDIYIVKEVRLDGHGGAKLLLNVWHEVQPC